MQRRTLIKTSLATATFFTTFPLKLFAQTNVSEFSARHPFRQPPLPYALYALEPVISMDTVDLHYNKHHAGYFKKLNQLVDGTPFDRMNLQEIVLKSHNAPQYESIFDNAGQALNHIQYWESFSPDAKERPAGRLAQAARRDFGSFEQMKALMVTSAGGLFGSGWTWLAETRDGKLEIVNTLNGDNPITQGKHPLLGIDVWEHAYYLDYQNRRTDHVRDVLDKLVDWNVVEARMQSQSV